MTAPAPRTGATATPPSAPDRGRAGPAWTLAPWAAAALGIGLAWIGPIQLYVTGRLRYGLVVVGLLVAAAIVACLPAVLRARPWRRGAIAWWFVAALAWAASAALGLRALPAAWRATGRSEVVLVAASLAAATGLLVLAWRRPVAFRALWLGVFLSTVPVAAYELATGRHIVSSRWGVGVWNFQALIGGPFTNPNDYGCVLAACVGALLAWSFDRLHRWARAALLLAAAGAAALIPLTQSRAALGAVAVQLVIAAVALAGRFGGWSGVRGAGPGRRLAAVLGIVVVALGVAAFIVPALAQHNPLLHQPKADEADSDALRVRLAGIGLRYWGQAPLLGTGPGSFEHRLAAERPAGVPDPTINLHDGFIEWGSQYGLLAALPLAALLVWVAWRALRPGLPTVARVEIAMLLAAYVVTAIDVSSSLAMPLWFVMLGHVTSAAARERDGLRAPGVQPEPARTAPDAAADPGAGAAPDAGTGRHAAPEPRTPGRPPASSGGQPEAAHD